MVPLVLVVIITNTGDNDSLRELQRLTLFVARRPGFPESDTGARYSPSSAVPWRVASSHHCRTEAMQNRRCITDERDTARTMETQSTQRETYEVMRDQNV